MTKDTFFNKKGTLNCRGKILKLDRPLVMGILNLTPDSFYDGGKSPSPDDASRRAELMLGEGATFIDLGAVSTKPGAAIVSEDEECQRLFPALEAIARRFPEAILSVDTWRSKVATEALARGAAIINDVSGGRFDEQIMSVAGQHGAPFIIMHMQGEPATMQDHPVYTDVVKEVMLFLSAQERKAHDAGISDVIIDPGFGFGKTTDHNYALLAKLETFSIFDSPLLVGFSRKSMINRVLKTTPATALNGTTVLNTIALLKGARILRVHDVKEAMQAVKITGQMGR